MFCLVFCGVFVSLDVLLGFWIFMYCVLFIIYWILFLFLMGMVYVDVDCVSNELVCVELFNGLICNEFFGLLVRSVGGYLVDLSVMS